MYNFSQDFHLLQDLQKANSSPETGLASHSLQREGMENNKYDTPKEISRLDIREQHLTLYCALQLSFSAELECINKMLVKLHYMKLPENTFSSVCVLKSNTR